MRFNIQLILKLSEGGFSEFLDYRIAPSCSNADPEKADFESL